jgi:hypothetical protein
MQLLRRIGKYAPALGAFVAVLIGSLMLLSRNDSSARAEAQLQVVVLSRALPAGTPAETVRQAAVVRTMPADAVVGGAIRSIADIADGVLASAHASGQQLSSLSMARSQAAAIGPDFVVTSVRLATANWSGALRITGTTVDIYALGDTGVQLVSRGAVVLNSPSVDEVQPGADSVITLAVRIETLGPVLLAAESERLWLVGR